MVGKIKQVILLQPASGLQRKNFLIYMIDLTSRKCFCQYFQNITSNL